MSVSQTSVFFLVLVQNNLVRSWQFCAEFLFQSAKLFLNKCLPSNLLIATVRPASYRYTGGQEHQVFQHELPVLAQE